MIGSSKNDRFIEKFFKGQESSSRVRLIKSNFNKILFFSVILILSSYLFYNQAFTKEWPNYVSDLKPHIKIAHDYANGRLSTYIPHFAFHFLITLVSTVFNLDFSYSAIVILSISTLLISLTIYVILKIFLVDYYSDNFILFLTACLLLVSAIYVPWFNKSVYLGQGSPNLWHNATLILVKPLSLICFLIFIKTIESTKIKLMGLLSFFLLISVFVKPNFALVFIPAMALYILLKHFKRFDLYKKSFMIVLPSLLALLYQAVNVMDPPLKSCKTKFFISFLGVWGAYTPNVAISLGLALAFPLAVLVLLKPWNVLKSKYLFLAWIFLLVSILQFAFLSEIGCRSPYSGNWSWGYNISLQIIFIFSTIEFFKYIGQRDKKSFFKKISIGVILYLSILHLISGTYYFLNIILGGSYY